MCQTLLPPSLSVKIFNFFSLDTLILSVSAKYDFDDASSYFFFYACFRQVDHSECLMLFPIKVVCVCVCSRAHAVDSQQWQSGLKDRVE